MIKHKFPSELKAVLFDMDGVLYDSMPCHAEAWKKVFQEKNIDIPEEWPYLQEGRTGEGFIKMVYQEKLNRNSTPEETEEIYKRKAAIFNSYPPSGKMDGICELICKIRETGLAVTIVTGSGQLSLIDKLNTDFPNVFQRNLMVTAFDVKKGKPDPEPYLAGLHKLGIKANEAIVVENAPLGVESAVAAGIFTVAVNTGILQDKVLIDAGANMLFHSIKEFANEWEKCL